MVPEKISSVTAMFAVMAMVLVTVNEITMAMVVNGVSHHGHWASHLGRREIYSRNTAATRALSKYVIIKEVHILFYTCTENLDHFNDHAMTNSLTIQCPLLSQWSWSWLVTMNVNANMTVHCTTTREKKLRKHYHNEFLFWHKTEWGGGG